MYKPLIPLATSLLLVIASGAVNASEDDFSQPIKIGSNTQFIDGKNKTALYKEDVLITQGSLVIEADEVEVIASEGSGREIFIARGKPASYSQTLEDGTPVSAKANEIRYEVINRTISLSGNAELQQDTSKVQGDNITFDMITEQLLATGGAGENGEGRVTTVFTPESIRKASSKKEDKDSEDNQ
ncbi:lipopolysaccharide transport periplasmic protein LptA [Alteromonas mediterranea]|uniref:Lipopolysaccharide export system protein LptA n=1 Tax=Alteromonas mediterranea TaxID=314275 RepID=A0AAC9NQZ3_9ALTE|nr:lipopolysaccharide transport periplasmic protein LptA [Alteromonas mediterranea]APD88924.1 lipopolysaccharide transport periplasmic protein LptA [Alteromonas mediterranea]APE01006.1 lipopolysaccharide transport periplasmic protein LptA [Alteromonas mediterranea]